MSIWDLRKAENLSEFIKVAQHLTAAYILLTIREGMSLKSVFLNLTAFSGFTFNKIALYRTIGLSMFDVNTKLRHDTSIRVNIVVPNNSTPQITQMKHYVTKSNKLVIVLKIQGNISRLFSPLSN
jgi:hypothetical protein